MAKGNTKRMTHHCPKEKKGNCRKAPHPTMGHMYCTKHQYYCSVLGCTWTPIQGQPCPVHGEWTERGEKIPGRGKEEKDEKDGKGEKENAGKDKDGSGEKKKERK